MNHKDRRASPLLDCSSGFRFIFASIFGGGCHLRHNNRGWHCIAGRPLDCCKVGILCEFRNIDTAFTGQRDCRQRPGKVRSTNFRINEVINLTPRYTQFLFSRSNNF